MTGTALGRRVLPHSIAMRTALAATLAALAAVSVLCAVTYSVTEAGFTHGLEMTIDTDLAGLTDIYASGGRRELALRLADREGVTLRDGRQPHYLLRTGTTPPGSAWPLDPARSGRGYIALPDGTPVYARATRLDADVALLVAREYAPERRTLRLLLLSFAIAGCGIVAAVFVLAWRQSLAVARRLDRINAAYRDPNATAIEALMLDASEDEIGELSRRSGQALARLQRLIESQRHVSEHVAHELRTPLLHLDGRLRHLARSVPEATDTVRLASADIRGITTMLEALLDIASSEAERGDRSNLVPVDLSSLVGDLAEVYRGSMEEAGIHFVTAIVPDATLCGDPTQLSRLVANLLDNAVKYVPAGGTVRLEVAAGPTIVVADDGPGIPPALQDQVFERFRRGGAAPVGAGHGLGLALARAIAERHDLTLTLRPSQRGARFVVAGDGA